MAPQESNENPTSGPNGASPGAGTATASPTIQPLASRPAQFMVASRQVPGLALLSDDVIAQSLANAPGIEIVKTIKPPAALGLQSTGSGGTAGTMLVARM